MRRVGRAARRRRLDVRPRRARGRASRAGCCTTTSARRSGCSPRSCGATATCGWPRSTSSSPGAATPERRLRAARRARSRTSSTASPSSSRSIFELFTLGRRNEELAAEFAELVRARATTSPRCCRPSSDEGVLHLAASPRRSPTCSSRSPTASRCGCSPSPTATGRPTIAAAVTAVRPLLDAARVTRSHTRIAPPRASLTGQPASLGRTTRVQGFMLRLDGVLRRRRRWVLARVGRRARRRASRSPPSSPTTSPAAATASRARSRRPSRTRSSATSTRPAARRSPPCSSRARAPALARDLDRVDARRPRRAARRAAQRDALARAARGRRGAAATRRSSSRSPSRRQEQDAIDIADRPARAPRPRRGGRRGVHLVGQSALWARMQEVAKEDVEKAERAGFPIVALILLAVFGSLAAASLPLALGLRLGARHRRADLRAVAHDGDERLRHEHGVDDRDRRRRRLLALRPRALPRGDPRRPRARRRARGRAGDLRRRRALLAASPSSLSLAGLFLIDTTALRSMAIGAILVVARRDARQRDAAAGAHLAARPSARGRAVACSAASACARRRGDRFWARWTERVMRRPVALARRRVGACCSRSPRPR